MGQLEGRTALITGATNGIGRAIAQRFAAEGAKLLLTGRNAERAQSLLDELQAAGTEAHFVLGDLRDEGFIDEIADAAVAHFGQLDIMALNAGVITYAPLAETTPDQYDEMMNVNVRAPWLCIRRMQALLADHASLMVTGSVSSFVVFPGEGVYCMTKAAVIQMVRTLALELADRKIRVNALCPGVIGGGGMTQESFDASADPAEEEAASAAMAPLGRVGTLSEIASGALFLASSESSFMTGNSLILDGGVTIPRV